MKEGWKQNLGAMLLGSIAREWTYNGLHNPSFIKKHSEVHHSLCNSLRSLSPTTLSDSFPVALGQSNLDHPLVNATNYFLLKMQQHMLPSQSVNFPQLSL